MSTGLPTLSLGDRIYFEPGGSAYELSNGDVFLVALCLQFDAYEAGMERAQSEAVERMRAKVPPGYSEPEPVSGWVDLLSAGHYGFARKFISKKVSS